MLYLLFFLLILIIVLIIINVVLTNALTQLNTIGGKKQYTYRLFSDGKFCEYLKHKLNALGWRELHNDTKYVDFAYRSYHKKLLTDKNISKKFKYIHADLKSTLDNFNKLGNKQLLAAIMKNSPYIVPTKKIHEYTWKDEDIIIVRETDSQQQKGIYIVINKSNFIKLKYMLLAKKRDAIVSKYITNPLLYKNKKQII